MCMIFKSNKNIFFVQNKKKTQTLIRRDKHSLLEMLHKVFYNNMSNNNFFLL